MFRKALAISLLTLALATPGRAEVSAVIAIVNDHPVTSYDVDQRIRLLQILGQSSPQRLGRKRVANDLINDYVKIDEATRFKINPTEKDIDERLRQMSQGMKTDEAGLKSKLAAQGLTLGALRHFASAQMSFARLLSAKYKEKVNVDQADVDRKFAAIKADIGKKVSALEADPRRQPVKVMQLVEVNFPVEGDDPQLLQSRAVEAGQVAQKIRSCGGITAATAGIFNVKRGRTIEADSRKLPAQLKSAMEKTGVGRAIGPMRYPKGIQLLAYCGSRTIVPPPIKYSLPTRQQIENAAMNDKFDQIEVKYVSQMRKTAIIEYKDPSYAQ